MTVICVNTILVILFYKSQYLLHFKFKCMSCGTNAVLQQKECSWELMYQQVALLPIRIIKMAARTTCPWVQRTESRLRSGTSVTDRPRPIPGRSLQTVPRSGFSWSDELLYARSSFSWLVQVVSVVWHHYRQEVWLKETVKEFVQCSLVPEINNATQR